MVNCYKCGKFYLFGANYDGLCRECYDVEQKLKREREELELKIKQQEEQERKRKKQEEDRKKEEERKLKQEKLKQKIILEQENIKKYEIEKEKIKEKYINIMLDRPEVLQLYISILKNKYGIDKKYKGYSENFFKTIFWELLLAGIKKTREFLYGFKGSFDRYKSSFFMNRYWETKNGKIVLELNKNQMNIPTLEEYMSTGNVEEIVVEGYPLDFLTRGCTQIYGYVNLFMDMIEFAKMIDEFENNKELFQIYNNMKDAEIDNEIIADKIYSLYKSLYQKSFKYALNEKDIKVIIEIENRNQMPKEYEDNGFDISSKSQLCKFIVNKLSDVSEEKRIVVIANILKSQKNMDKELKFDIVVNMDEILKEIEKHIQKKKKQNEISKAEKERDRLLKGDFSKEKEIEELSLSTENIRDGFEFENYVANLYKKLGYTIEQVTKKSGDQGADVVAIKDGKRYAIQAKFYSKPVSNDAVQEIVAALAKYKADKGIVITNSTFTKSAIELANVNNIELVDGDEIERYKKQILAKL